MLRFSHFLNTHRTCSHWFWDICRSNYIFLMLSGAWGKLYLSLKIGSSPVSLCQTSLLVSQWPSLQPPWSWRTCLSNVPECYLNLTSLKNQPKQPLFGNKFSRFYNFLFKVHLQFQFCCGPFSLKLSQAVQNYDIGNWKLLTVKVALENYRHWLEGAEQPESKNTKPNSLSHLHSPDPPQEESSFIFPCSCVVGAIQWEVEERVKQAQITALSLLPVLQTVFGSSRIVFFPYPLASFFSLHVLQIKFFLLLRNSPGGSP